jgi:hypothetical protein
VLLNDAISFASSQLLVPGVAEVAVAALKACLDPKVTFFKRFGHPPGVSLADLPQVCVCVSASMCALCVRFCVYAVCCAQDVCCVCATGGGA